MPFLASLVWQWPSQIKREYTWWMFKRPPTSKSWRFNISSRGGLFEKRSSRAFSSSVIWTSTFSTVSGSTGPKLWKTMGSKHRIRISEVFYCFSGGRFVVIASGGWMGSYSCLIRNVYRVMQQSIIRDMQELRCIFPGIFQYNFTTACGMLSVV